MSTPDTPEVVFHPPAPQARITVSLADLLERFLGGAVGGAEADTNAQARIVELAAELLAELRRAGA